MKRLPSGGQWLLIILLTLRAVHAQSPNDASFLSTLGELREATYSEKASIVERLSQSGHPSVRAVLTAFLEDRLYFRNSDQKVFIVKSAEGDPLNLVDPLSLRDAGSTSADSLTQIGTNNGLRRMLRTTVAHFALASPEVSVRLDAVRSMLRSLDDATVALLRERLGVETNVSVKKEIGMALALAALDGSDAKVRLEAIATLKQSVSQDVRNRLALLLDKSPGGTFVESDEKVRRAAAGAVETIDYWRTFYSGIQILFFGLSLGSVLVLIAIGLAITFGVMGVINMAHGELMMLGAYTTYAVQMAMPGHIGISILAAIPAAFVVAGLIGVLMERTIIRFLYGRPLETLLATFGVSLILQQSVRSVFSALNRSVVTPGWMSGSLRLNDALEVTYNRLYVVIFTLMVFALILVVLKRTRIGLDIRAVAQNRAMARAMGIRTEWVDAMTFGLGSGVAGMAGVALSQLTNVGPNLGQSYIIDSFMVVVFGGVGNLWGSLIGGMSMGIVNELLEPYAGAVLAKIFILIALILFIQARPRGLFPQAGRAAEDK
ncbi:MAG TPA: urea ABC transporter permease subunit UrtB [Candidatus Limnocylindrales bacterium]|nr:urea ABC transporter permease subunit UrtB [Bryobacteraceae bacterium]HXJ14692.1 urea ABC transporter permease subunit UrtB [Candidatus Limnocylindrales bacterium]